MDEEEIFRIGERIRVSGLERNFRFANGYLGTIVKEHAGVYEVELDGDYPNIYLLKNQMEYTGEPRIGYLVFRREDKKGAIPVALSYYPINYGKYATLKVSVLTDDKKGWLWWDTENPGQVEVSADEKRSKRWLGYPYCHIWRKKTDLEDFLLALAIEKRRVQQLKHRRENVENIEKNARVEVKIEGEKPWNPVSNQNQKLKKEE